MRPKLNRLCFVLMVLALVSLACLNAPQPKAAPAVETTAPPEVLPSDTPIPPMPEPPIATTAPPPPPTPSLLSVTFEGLNFSFDPAIAASAANSKLAPVGEGQGAPWEIQPETIQSKFEGYAHSGAFTDPVILVYPVQEFSKLSPAAAKQIDKLRNLLATRPATAPADGMPFLPIWNAAQMMSTKIEYLDFANGSGVRYLTQYGQAAAPINNTYLFYTFQGLTADGKYAISAILPVANPILPPDPSIVPGNDYEKFNNEFATYLADIEKKLAAQPDDSFQPHLGLLDDMIKTIKINK